MSTQVTTIPNDSRVKEVQYSPQFSAVCSVGKAPFWGEILIKYKPQDKLLEFESFESWLRENSLTRTTIEGFCRLVFDVLCEVLGDISLSVTVTARTTVHAPVSAIISQTGDDNE